jgi:protein-disulfide isomerase
LEDLLKKTFISFLLILASNLSGLAVDTSMHPTMGSSDAPVHVVAFLEPKCPDSKRYNNTSFTKLKTDFIDQNKVRYTVITTSFLSQSMPAAIALLCVYNQDPEKPNPDAFFKYLDYIYLNQPPEKENWATIETLQKMAAIAVPSLNLEDLKKCIESGRYKAQIEKNTAYGNQLMSHLSTPTIYVDGVKIENSDDTIDYENLQNAINQGLSHK